MFFVLVFQSLGRKLFLVTCIIHYLKVGNTISSNYIKYKSNGAKDKTLSIQKEINKIRPHLGSLINDLKNKGEWKIYLSMKNNSMTSENATGTRTMCSKSDNIEIILANETDEIIQELLEFFTKI